MLQIWRKGRMAEGRKDGKGKKRLFRDFEGKREVLYIVICVLPAVISGKIEFYPENALFDLSYAIVGTTYAQHWEGQKRHTTLGLKEKFEVPFRRFRGKKAKELT